MAGMPSDAAAYADLISCGVSPARIRTMTAARGEVALRRGVYAEAGQGTVRRSLAAAEVALTRPWVASHGSAALLHGLALLRSADTA